MKLVPIFALIVLIEYVIIGTSFTAFLFILGDVTKKQREVF